MQVIIIILRERTCLAQLFLSSVRRNTVAMLFENSICNPWNVSGGLKIKLKNFISIKKWHLELLKKWNKNNTAKNCNVRFGPQGSNFGACCCSMKHIYSAYEMSCSAKRKTNEKKTNGKTEDKFEWNRKELCNFIPEADTRTRCALSEFIKHEILYRWTKSVATAKCVLGVGVCNKTCMRWNNFIFDSDCQPTFWLYISIYLSATHSSKRIDFVLQLHIKAVKKSGIICRIYKKKMKKKTSR